MQWCYVLYFFHVEYYEIGTELKESYLYVVIFSDLFRIIRNSINPYIIATQTKLIIYCNFQINEIQILRQ